MRSIRYAVVLAALAGLLCACKEPPPAQPARAQAPVEVAVVKAQREDVPFQAELAGRIAPRRVAEIRARVPGILLQRRFSEGSDVKPGQLLFQIDPAPLRARFDSARAALQRAKANLAQVTALTKRNASLIEVHAVSEQEVDDAEALKLQREAELLEAEASLRTAQLDLSYATVKAPIGGRIGKALVTEGALVGQGEATALAVIQQLDPVYFDFEQSSAELLALRRMLESGKLTAAADGAAKITLLLDDGSEYEHPGKLLFSDVTVDERTNMVTLRAEVPNPKGMLLPGMFARARLDQAVTRNAITVPQRAVALGPNGTASVLVVGPGNKVEQRKITLERALGERWVVSSGLEADSRVIIEGRQKARAGDVVSVVDYAPDKSSS